MYHEYVEFISQLRMLSHLTVDHPEAVLEQLRRNVFPEGPIPVLYPAHGTVVLQATHNGVIAHRSATWHVMAHHGDAGRGGGGASWNTAAQA